MNKAELIRKIVKLAFEYIGKTEIEQYTLAEGMHLVVDDFIKELSVNKTENDWISVDIELPPDNLEVISFFRGWDGMTFQRVLEYDSSCEEWSDHNGQDGYKVTHWKHLSENPK